MADHITPGTGQSETNKLKSLLEQFIADPPNAHIYLDNFYHLYCGSRQEDGRRKFAYKFLGNLGLNYLYWLGEGYLQTCYGTGWEKEYRRSLEEVPFYQQQLKLTAEKILASLNNGDITILDDGTYQITQDLKSQLESNTIFQLKHPKRLQ